MGLIADEDEQEVPDATHGSKERNDEAAHAISIRKIRNSNAAKECDQVCRSSQTLRVDRGVSHVCDNCGKKVGEASEAVIAAEMDQGVKIVPPINEAECELAPLHLILSCSILGCNALNGFGSLLRRQELGSSWRVG